MKYLLILCCFFLSNKVFTQVTRLDSLLTNKQYTIVERELSELLTFNKDSNYYWYYYGKLYTDQRNLKQAFFTLKIVDTTQLTQQYKGWYYYVLGDVYRYTNQEEKAYELKLKAQKLFSASGNSKMANEVNYDLHYTLSSQDFLQYNGESYITAYFKNAAKRQDTVQLLKAHLVLSLADSLDSTLEETRMHLYKATQYANAIGTVAAKYRLHNYKANYYQYNESDFEKAKIHIDSMLHYAKLLKAPDRLDSSLKTKAYWYRLQGNYKDAIATLIETEKLPIKENIYNRKRHLYEYLSLNHESLGNIDSALYYHQKMVAYSDSVSISEQNTMLTLLETVELSKKNLEIDAALITQKNRSFMAFVLLVAVIIISIVLVLYYRSKKKLAEKEKELKAIDARNEEKDYQRQRIAGELHDNLGSLIVAIQQCFENLKVSKSRFIQEEESLMTTTKELLDEAYQKIRNMAHLEDSASRNSGYWVDVIKDFAAIMNESNQLSVDVQSHGEANITNISIENDLRRMTTELITNAVKHAQASEIVVDITTGENFLTIIVEDDGVGFDQMQAEKQKGLGLYSIQKKAEELKGKLTIESVPEKGTTFIIEIPI